MKQKNGSPKSETRKINWYWQNHFAQTNTFPAIQPILNNAHKKSPTQ